MMRFIAIGLLLLTLTSNAQAFDVTPVVDYVEEVISVSPTIGFVARVAENKNRGQSLRFQSSFFWPICGVRISTRYIFLEAAGSAIRYIDKLPDKETSIWVPTGYLGFGSTFTRDGDGGIFIGAEINRISIRPFVGMSFKIF